MRYWVIHLVEERQVKRNVFSEETQTEGSDPEIQDRRDSH